MNAKELFEKHSQLRFGGKYLSEEDFIAALSEALCCGQVEPIVSQSGSDGSSGPKIIGVDEIAAIIEECTVVTDEWGGSKLANWAWGGNVLVGGIDEAAEEIYKKLIGE